MTAWIWTEKAIAWACLLQALEFTRIKPWDWKLLDSEIPRALAIGARHDRVLLTLQMVTALAILWQPFLIGNWILAITTTLLSIRWRGNFNGGSDSMTFQILAALAIGGLLPASIRPVGLLFIAVQILASYFAAGIAKVRRSGWRDGSTLAHFLGRSGRLRALSWIVILFELSFPLCVLDLRWAYVYLVFGALFHLVNFYLFGLNRFFWVWISGYPAVVFLAQNRLRF